MSRVSDCRLCGKVHALGPKGEVLGPNDGLPSSVDPTAMLLKFHPYEERDSGWMGRDQQATLCATCAAPLRDYLVSIGVLA